MLIFLHSWFTICYLSIFVICHMSFVYIHDLPCYLSLCLLFAICDLSLYLLFDSFGIIRSHYVAWEITPEKTILFVLHLATQQAKLTRAKGKLWSVTCFTRLLHSTNIHVTGTLPKFIAVGSGETLMIFTEIDLGDHSD